MTFVIPHSTSPISIVPGAAFNTRKSSSLRRCCVLKSNAKRTSYPQNCILPLSASVRLFPHIRTCDLHHKRLLKAVSASGIDVAVGEPGSSVAVEDSSESVEGSSVQSEEDSSSEPKRARSGRKSEMPPVKNEDLVPGATFTGKVRSIQPFGAFVDFGGFSEGLVHISQLSDNFVKDVGDVVSVGEEVQVRILEANVKTGRVSLSMRSSDSTDTDSDRKGPPRRNSQNSNQNRDARRERPTTKFELGQNLEGTVKNMTKSGAFISLPDGEEGFLPQSEEASAGMGKTTLEVGQQVSVRVLRITRGQATLTMKMDSKIDDDEWEVPLGNVYKSESPLLAAFRKNKLLLAFIKVREQQKEAEALKNAEIAARNIVEESVLTSDALSPEESVSSVDQVAETIIETLDVTEVKSDEGSIVDEVQIETPTPEAAVSSPPPVEIEKAEADSVDLIAETAIDTPEMKSGGSIIDEVQIETLVSEVAVSSPPPVEIEKAEADSDESSNIKGEVQAEEPSDANEITSPSPIEEAKAEPDENSITTSSLENVSEV